MENNCTYIDFDGVILDSEERMLCRKSEVGFINHNNSDEFIKYFEYTNTHPEEWDYILRNAVPINNSVEILQELEMKLIYHVQSFLFHQISLSIRLLYLTINYLLMILKRILLNGMKMVV